MHRSVILGMVLFHGFFGKASARLYEYMELPGITMTSDHHLVLAGYTDIHDDSLYGGIHDGMVVKLSGDGKLVWTKILTEADSQTLSDVVALSDGGVIAVGQVAATPDNTNGWLIKLNSRGDIEWQERPGGKPGEYLKTAVLNREGNIVSAGGSQYLEPLGRCYLTTHTTKGRLLNEKRCDQEGIEIHKLRSFNGTLYFSGAHSRILGARIEKQAVIGRLNDDLSIGQMTACGSAGASEFFADFYQREDLGFRAVGGYFGVGIADQTYVANISPALTLESDARLADANLLTARHLSPVGVGESLALVFLKVKSGLGNIALLQFDSLLNPVDLTVLSKPNNHAPRSMLVDGQDLFIVAVETDGFHARGYVTHHRMDGSLVWERYIERDGSLKP